MFVIEFQFDTRDYDGENNKLHLPSPSLCVLEIALSIHYFDEWFERKTSTVSFDLGFPDFWKYAQSKCEFEWMK